MQNMDVVQIQPRKRVLHHADYTAPTPTLYTKDAGDRGLALETAG